MITATGVAVPEDMAQALAADASALAVFEQLRPDDQREYVNWLAKPGSQSRSERLAEIAGHIKNHKHKPAPEGD